MTQTPRGMLRFCICQSWSCQRERSWCSTNSGHRSFWKYSRKVVNDVPSTLVVEVWGLKSQRNTLDSCPSSRAILVFKVSILSYLFHLIWARSWSPMQGHSTLEVNFFAPQQAVQLFATHCRGYTRELASFSQRRACHKSPANLYSRAPLHLQTPELLRPRRKLYKS